MTKGAIFSLTLVVLMASIVVLMVIFKTGSDIVSSQGLSINSQGVVISNEAKTCQTDSDCAIVMTKCSSCSCGETVNKKYTSEVQQLYAQACKNYQGAVCDMACSPDQSIVKCIDNLCVQQFRIDDL